MAIPLLGRAINAWCDERWFRGGCGAINHGMGFDDSLGDEDEVFDHDGVKFVVNKQAATTLEGVTIDYAETAMSSGFTISNPNAQRCGCGGGGHH